MSLVKYTYICCALFTAFTTPVVADSSLQPPEPIITQNWESIPFVLVTDPVVISAANFAVQTIKVGSLYKIIFAQKQDVSNGEVYILTLELVDAHSIHHNYAVQVFIPNDDATDDSTWQVIYSNAVEY